MVSAEGLEPAGCLMHGNYVQNSWQAIEMSSGSATDNYILTCTNGMITGAGGGGAPLTFHNNRISACKKGIDIAFSPTVIEDLAITNSVLHNVTGQGISINNISTFQLKNNTIYTWATGSAGSAITIGAAASFGHVDGNIMRGAGAFSTGNLVNSGTSITLGTNPVF